MASVFGRDGEDNRRGGNLLRSNTVYDSRRVHMSRRVNDIRTMLDSDPWFRSWEGTLRASLRSGQIGYDPAPYFEQATNEGRKTQIRLIAHPIRPEMICRTLIKIGIEVVAEDNPVDVFHERYDAARVFALEGRKPGDWWYLQREDINAASRFIAQGVSPIEWRDGVQLSVSELADHAEVFHLRLLYLDFLVPLDPRIQAPPVADMPEPEYRLFIV